MDQVNSIRKMIEQKRIRTGSISKMRDEQREARTKAGLDYIDEDEAYDPISDDYYLERVGRSNYQQTAANRLAQRFDLDDDELRRVQQMNGHYYHGDVDPDIEAAEARWLIGGNGIQDALDQRQGIRGGMKQLADDTYATEVPDKRAELRAKM